MIFDLLSPSKPSKILPKGQGYILMVHWMVVVMVHSMVVVLAVAMEQWTHHSPHMSIERDA